MLHEEITIGNLQKRELRPDHSERVRENPQEVNISATQDLLCS